MPFFDQSGSKNDLCATPQKQNPLHIEAGLVLIILCDAIQVCNMSIVLQVLLNVTSFTQTSPSASHSGLQPMVYHFQLLG
jgi:hypothetical protein